MIVAAILCFSVVVAADFEIPNRISVAKVGEWATYTMPNDYVQKQTVVSRTGNGQDDTVVVKIENIYQGQVITTAEVVEPAGKPLREVNRPEAGSGIEVDVKNTTMHVKGKSIPVTVIEVEYDEDDDDDYEVKWYLSAEVPVFGIVRQETDGDVEYELLDFGTN